jgi:hypothetical protein
MNSYCKGIDKDLENCKVTCNCEISQKSAHSCLLVYLFFNNFYTKP